MEGAIIIQLGAIIICVLSAIFSAVGAGFSIYKAKNIFGFQTKLKFYENKIEKLLYYFEGGIIINRKVTQQEFVGYSDEDYADTLKDYTVVKVFIVKFYFQYQHLFSSANQLNLNKMYNEFIDAYTKLNEIKTTSKREIVASTFIPYADFVYELQLCVLKELKETSTKLSGATK